MELGHLIELLGSAFAADPATADLASLKGAFGAARRLQAVLDGRSATLAAAMGRHTVFPEKQVAEAAAMSLSEAGRVVARGETLGETPALAGACAQGRVTASHVDAYAKVLKNVSAPVAEQLRATPRGWWTRPQRCRRRSSRNTCGVKSNVSRRPVMMRSVWSASAGRCGCGRSLRLRGWVVGSRSGIRRRTTISRSFLMPESRRCSMTARPSFALPIRSNANSSCAPTRWSI